MSVERIRLPAAIRQVRLKSAVEAAGVPVPPPAPPVHSQEKRREAEVGALRELSSALVEAVGELESRRRQSLEELQHVAIELAIAAASHLVGEAIDAGQFAVERLVADAVALLGLGSPIVVSLNPDDLALLKSRLGDRPPDWPVDSVRLQPDASLERGACRADSADELALLSDVGTRLSSIRRHWLEGIDEAQVERRSDAGHPAPIRRFPDRRETA